MMYAALIILSSSAIGSFISVVGARYPDWRAIAIGRSHCLRCGRILAARELIPIISWLAQRGRCRGCGCRIGARYLWIELAALAVAVWSASMTSGPLLLVTCGLGWTLIALATIDMRHFVLPDAITLPLIVAGLAVSWLYHPGHLLENAVGPVAGYMSFVLLSIAYRRLRGREGLGRGDAKLFAAAGAWVAWWGLPSVAVVAGMTGLGAALLQARVKGKPIDLTARLPFGPFLAFGLWVVWLYGPLVLRF